MQNEQDRAIADISAATTAQIVCVLGMHRSGTSLVTRIINLLGASLGPTEQLMPPVPDNNPKGFWEHQPIVDLNKEILSRLGGTWDEPPTFPSGWVTDPKFDDLRERARTIVEGDFAEKSWCWKDPRACLTLPFWQQIAPPMQYVVCLRNPLDVARSLQRRDGFSMEKGHRLWLAYTAAALQHSKNHPRLLVFYEDFMENWPGALTRLATFLGRAHVAVRSEVHGAVQEFVEEDLQHFRASLHDILHNPHVIYPVRALYMVLRLYVDLARTRSARVPLSDADLERALENFSRRSVQAIDDMDALQVELARQAASVQDQQMAIAGQQRAIRSQRAAIEDKQRQIAKLTAEQERLARQLAQLEVDGRANQLELDVLKASLLWQLLGRYRSLKEKLLPSHTRRRRLYESTLSRLKGRHARSPSVPVAAAAVPAPDTRAEAQIEGKSSLLLKSVETFIVEHPPDGGAGHVRASGWLLVVGQVEPAEVEVRCDGTAKARAVANIERPDVPQVYTDPGLRKSTSIPYCGFDLGAPVGADVKRVELILVTRFGEQILAEKQMHNDGVGEQTVAQREPAGRIHTYGALLAKVGPKVRQKFFSKQALSPRQWHVWLHRVTEEHARLQQLRQSAGGTPIATRRPYETYVENNAISPAMRELLVAAAGRFRIQPRISILMPVYNIDPHWLRIAVESVKNQIYSHWELCIADDGSTNAELLAYLHSLRDDSRIKIVFRPDNGHICAASNSAADLATGEFVALMDNDDVLAPHALFEIVRLLQQHPDADLIYSDEDKMDERERRYDPQFKPDWSPEMFLAYNYINHLACLRRNVFERAGRFREGFEGAQDYDLLLRIVSSTVRIHHIPKVLYHWRALGSSTAASAAVKPIVHSSARAALREHLQRAGVPASPYTPEFARRLNLPIDQLDWSDDGPSVAILILARVGVSQLRKCVASLLEKTTYGNYRLVVVDDGAAGPDTGAYLKELPALGVSVERLAVEDGCCSSARLYNVAAERVAEDLVLFLSGDTEVTEPKWLSRLAGYLSLPGVGATGARLVSHNGRILTAGKVLGMRNGLAPGDAFAGWPASEPSYYFQAEIARPCSAVSSACLLMSRKVFLEIGGFDERRYPDGLHDVDLCLRLAQRGERTLCVGSAQLVHHTGEFAVSESGPAALAEFRRDHGHRKDPYYNRNLSAVETYQIDTGCHLDYESYADQPVSTLLVTHNLNLEGAPRVLWKLAVGLNRRAKVRSKVYSPLAGAAEKWFRGSAVEISIQPLPKCRNVLEGWMSRDDYEASVQAMQHLLQQEQPAVVIANTLNSFYAVDAAKRSGIPSIWIIHESYTRERMSQAINPCVLASCEKAFADAYRVVFVSTDTMRLYQQYNGTQNFVVLHNGIDALPIDQYIAQVAKPEAARRTDAPANKKLIVSVGTVCERKSQLTLVQAAELLRERRADFCCYIVGLREGDSYSEYVRRCVRQKKLEDVVRLVPETDQVYQYLRAADMFVLASHIEAFSLSILEAEAFALPIITTPCHGISEQVHHEVNALMFNMSDPESLARHIATLLDDAQRCAQMGRDSRLVFEGLCTHEEMLERYERLVLGAWMRGPCRPATV